MEGSQIKNVRKLKRGAKLLVGCLLGIALCLPGLACEKRICLCKNNVSSYNHAF